MSLNPEYTSCDKIFVSNSNWNAEINHFRLRQCLYLQVKRSASRFPSDRFFPPTHKPEVDILGEEGSLLSRGKYWFEKSADLRPRAGGLTAARCVSNVPSSTPWLPPPEPEESACNIVQDFYGAVILTHG